MAFSEMSLPVDIPWKRMGVSQDMIDPEEDDLEFPTKWNSSVAVFYHEPVDLPPEYCNRKITYLKVTCTITNHNPWRYQLGDQITAWENVAGWASHHYEDLTASIPCHGALLQVTVFPNPREGVQLHDFPYIAAFEPRKREMYETVSESGEVLSQSANNVNVGKQLTDTASNETYDLDTGSSYSHGVSGSGGWGLASGSEEWSQSTSGQWGTVARNNRQDQKVSAVDSSRDKRESFSHSTTLNHVYSLLQSYHVGTNRALFFLQPRPHIQDTKFTFIQGPRRVEGIQEFFLIVNRPATIPGFCVEISLETAHVYMLRKYQPRLIPLSHLYIDGNLNKTPDALGIPVSDFPYEGMLATDWNGAPAEWRYKTALAHTGAYEGPSLGNLAYDHGIPFGSLKQVLERLPDIGTEDVALILEAYDALADNFFVLGRWLKSCAQPNDGDRKADIEVSNPTHLSELSSEPWLLYSRPFDNSLAGTQIGGDYNAMGQAVERAFLASVDSPNRYRYGELTYYESTHALTQLSQLERLLIQSGVEDVRLDSIEALRPFLEKGLGSKSNVEMVSELAELDTRAIARDLADDTADLSDVEARRAHRAILTAAHNALDVHAVQDPKPFVNPIRERFKHRFPAETLKRLVDSAHFQPPPKQRRWWWPFRR